MSPSGALVAAFLCWPVGIVLGFLAFRRLTPAGTLRAVPGLPSAVLLRGFLTFAFFAADAYVALAVNALCASGGLQAPSMV